MKKTIISLVGFYFKKQENVDDFLSRFKEKKKLLEKTCIFLNYFSVEFLLPVDVSYQTMFPSHFPRHKDVDDFYSIYTSSRSDITIYSLHDEDEMSNKEKKFLDKLKEVSKSLIIWSCNSEKDSLGEDDIGLSPGILCLSKDMDLLIDCLISIIYTRTDQME